MPASNSEARKRHEEALEAAKRRHPCNQSKIYDQGNDLAEDIRLANQPWKND